MTQTQTKTGHLDIQQTMNTDKIKTVNKVVKLKQDYQYTEKGRVIKAGTEMEVSPELAEELKLKKLI